MLALAYFPSLLGSDPKKYAALATWLVSRFGIVNYALRDTFSAGGQIPIKGINFPKIYEHVTDDLNAIYENIQTIPEDDISHYWRVECVPDDRISLWKKQCLMHCQDSLSQEQFSLAQGYFFA